MFVVWFLLPCEAAVFVCCIPNKIKKQPSGLGFRELPPFLL